MSSIFFHSLWKYLFVRKMTSNQAAMNKNYAKKITSVVTLNNFSSSDNVREGTFLSVASYHSVYYR